jgi:7,8-dihydropterin-6-yl-methyl-4-(beta-D-ribofuranosyl)aminobenzene 5'-phosphate synthase
VRYRKSDRKQIGLPLSFQEAKRKYNITLTKEPLWVTDNLLFLGEIPRENDFEGKSTSFYNEDRFEDFVADDSAAVAKTPYGLVVVCGCSHAGVCNTVEYARKVTGEDKVYAVLGGFHLKYLDAQLDKTIEYFKQLNVTHLTPSHCTSFEALYVFRQNFGSKLILTGEILEF